MNFLPAGAWRGPAWDRTGAASSRMISIQGRFRLIRPTGAKTTFWGDVADLTLADLPVATVDLSWASFPCQDLSLAGSYRGLGRERGRRKRTRSGTFWPFWKLMRGLVQEGRAPRTIVLENVYGCLTSHGGTDFAAIASALSSSGYTFGAAVINAAHFVPVASSCLLHCSANRAIASTCARYRRAGALLASCGSSQSSGEDNGRRKTKLGLVENPEAGSAKFNFHKSYREGPNGRGVAYRSAHKKYVLELMSPVNRGKVTDAMKSGRKMVGAIYRRTRPNEYGIRRQRAEVRFDDIAGCLRTPAGGSSRQTIFSWLKAGSSGRAFCRLAKRRA